MISSQTLYKLLATNYYPKCVNCVHFRPRILHDGYCKIFSNIIKARVSEQYCGLKGTYYKPTELYYMLKSNKS